MKLRNLLITLGLTFTVGAGVAVATSATQNEEPKAAEATTPSTGNFIYAVSDQRALNAYIWKDGGSSFSGWPGSKMTKIGSSTTFYLSVANKTNYNRVIFNNNGDSWKTGDLQANFSNTVFYNFSQGSTSFGQCGLSATDFYLATNENNWSSSTDQITFSTTGTTAHRYHISYTFSNAGGQFKVVHGSNWWGYDSLNQGGLDTAHITKDDTDGNCCVTVPGTLDIWFTPKVSYYGEKNYIINGVDGAINFTPSVYTITYDRNKNDGTQATQNKTAGNDVTAYTPGTAPINTAAWNPSNFKRFKHWNTKYDDSGDQINAGSTITSDSSFTLYYIEDWYDYRFYIGNNGPYTLTHNDTDKPGDTMVQFKAGSQTLTQGLSLRFQYSNNGGSTWSNVSSITFEGNYDSSTNKIKMTTTDSLYLKISNSGNYSCWVPGVSDRYVAVCNSADATSGTSYGMRSNSYTETVTTGYVYIQKGQYLKRGYDGTLYETYLLSGGASAYFSQVGSDTAILCNMTGAYTVYNQAGSYGNWHDILIERVEEVSASYLAQLFNDTVEAVCSAVAGGTKGLSDLQAIWGSNASSDLYKHFNGQPSTTKAYFSTSSGTTDAEILECVERYDYIERKYGTTALPDFLGRNNSYPASAQNHILISLFGQSGGLNSNIIVIVVIASLGLLSVGGYYFFRKSRKTEE